MAKLVLGPFDKGLQKDVTAFNIDNNSFATLINAYQWRGRVKRKRGTEFLGRLERALPNTMLSVVVGASPWTFNIFTASIPPITEPNAQVDSISVELNGFSIKFGDQRNGILTSVTPGNSGTINYTTGQVTLITTAPIGSDAFAQINYFPDLPVMGLEDLQLKPSQFPGTIAFDTKYSYDISTADPYPITDVTYYKNPATATYPGYVAKTVLTPFTWNGQNYQQFWSVNDEGALFVTNGIPIPFSPTNIGMQFLPATSITSATQMSATTVDFVIASTPLVIGDFVFANEFTGAGGSSLNFQTGYVTAIVGTTYTVTFPNATIIAGLVPGILQYLTNTSDATKDPLRYYDGNPVDGLGWVNFSPPLSQSVYSVSGLPPAQYYLVGARIIEDFKDRLLYLGCVVQNSTGGVFYLPDTVIYSQNGTPYYTSSFTGAVDSAQTVFTTILVPENQTSTANAWFEDDTGFGGFISADISEPLTTVSNNEDVLIVGFSFSKARLVYTSNDLIPFVFYFINSELGDASTFSVIDMDKGVITRGTRGYLISSQTQTQRIDLSIPDEVFQIDLTNNGNERFTAIRNFINEWIYFTYNANDASEGVANTAIFPNRSLFYNYRDNSWAIFNESYTTYGDFRKQSGFTWQTVGSIYQTWDQWNQPWNSGTSTLLQQLLLAGNQQGFVIIRDVGTSEGNSLYIKSFSNGTNIVTSADHNLNNNDYIIISGCLGTVGNLVNGNIYQIFDATRDTFRLSPDPLITTETYIGKGLIKLAYVPFIQTKQFPMAWEMARKTRIGTQQYLFTRTDDAQITLQLYLSQNAESPYNNPPIVPDADSVNNSLIYSQVLYTCPESTNLGLTPANINLNTPTASQQAQIWHRKNTSLIGDTVQIGFTLSDAQMRDLEVGNAYAEIEFHGAIMEIYPSQLLC